MAANFLQSLGQTERFALILAAAITLVFVVAQRRSATPTMVGLAAFLPVPVVALFSKQFDIVGWHGLMHVSPMYQIMELRVLVPEEPLFAGASLRYPWIEHLVLAKVSLLTGINPLILALVAETFAYLALLAAAAVIAGKVSRDPIVVALTVLLSGYGISIFHSGLFAEPLARAFPPLWLETRVVPIDKYLNVTAAPIAYAAMAVSAAAGLELLTRERRGRRLTALIAACTLCAALVHPLSWLGLLVYQGTIALFLLVRREREATRRAAEVALAVIVPSALCFPYHRSLSRSESSDGFMGLTDSWALFASKLADLAFFLATFAVLAYVHRAELRRRLRERDAVTLALGTVIGSLSVAYLLVRMAGRNEYKFLLDLVPAAAPLMALALREVLRRHAVLALALLFLLLIPGGMILGSRPWFQVTDPARLEGRYHRALDPAADALFDWVATHSPKDAVFLAPDLRTPPFGRRSLYVAVDAPWRGRDGWGLPRTSLLQWHVRRPDQEMYRRQHLATIVLNPDWAAPPSETMAAIQRDVPGRPLYVHAWHQALAEKLARTPGFTRRFANGAGAIFSYQAPSTQPSAGADSVGGAFAVLGERRRRLSSSAARTTGG
jgi:hypothetical protein